MPTGVQPVITTRSPFEIGVLFPFAGPKVSTILVSRLT